MLFLKKSVLSFLLIFSASALATPLDVDKFLRTVDITQFVYQNEVLNLEAQLSDPVVGTKNVDEMSEFIALAVNDKMQTIMTEFDAEQKIQKQKIIDMPWIGVGRYIQSDIPSTTLQEGFGLVQTCMAKKHKRTGTEIARVTIYKTIQTGQIVYDYAFKMPNSPTTCQEVLYLPVTGECELGMKVNCRHNIDL